MFLCRIEAEIRGDPSDAKRHPETDVQRGVTQAETSYKRYLPFAFRSEVSGRHTAKTFGPAGSMVSVPLTRVACEL